MADWNSGLQIVDITDIANPTHKDWYFMPNVQGITVSGNYAYMAVWDSGLYIAALNLDKLVLSGTPNSVGTYNVTIKACNEVKECVTDSFDIIVKKDSSNKNTTDLTIVLIIIGSITAGAICVTGFCCSLIIGGGVALKRYRNKDAKRQQSSESTIFLINDTEIEKNYRTLKENPQFLNMI